MKTYKFDCNGRLSPAYTCSEPGDCSGEYVKLSEVRMLLDELLPISDQLSGTLNAAWRESVSK